MALKFDYDNSWIETLRVRNFATGSLPAAGAATKGAIYLDSTLNTLVYDNGTVLQTLSAGGLSGSLTSTRIPYATSSSTLSDSANLIWDNTNSIQTITGRLTMVTALGSLGAVNNGIDLTGTLSSNSTPGSALNLNYASASSATPTSQRCAIINVSGGYTGSGPVEALHVSASGVASTSANFRFGNNSISGIRGLHAEATGASGHTGGVYGYASTAQATTIVGVWGDCSGVSSVVNSIGVIGNAPSTVGTATGGYFSLWPVSTALPTFVSSALTADNAGTANAVFLGRVNSATKFTIGSTGDVSIANFGTAGTVIYNSTTGGLLAQTNVGTSGQALLSTAGAAPAFGNLGTAAGGTGLSGATPFTSGAIMYASSTSALATDAQLLWSTANKTFTLGDGGTTKTRFTMDAGTLLSGQTAWTINAAANTTAGQQTGYSFSYQGGTTSNTVNYTAYSFNFNGSAYTGGGTANSVNIANSSTGVGTQIHGNGASGNRAIYATCTGTTVGSNMAVYGEASGAGAGKNIAIRASAFNGSATNIGVYSASDAGTVQLSGYFGLHTETTIPTFVSAALIADNGNNAAAPIFLGRANGTTKFTVNGSGNVLVANFATLGAVVYNSSASGQLAITAQGTAGQTLLSNVAATPVWVDQQSQTRNWVTNGRFNIWQRNTTFAATGYTADRWLMTLGTGAAITCSRTAQTLGQVAVPGEPQFFLAFNRTTTGSTASTLEHRIEGVRSLAGKTIVASWYAKASAGTPAITWDIVQNFGTGGAPSGSVTTNLVTNEAITTSFVRYTHSITIPSISGKTIGTNGNDYVSILFTLPTAAGVVEIDLIDVQVEIGSIVSVFEIPTSFQKELAVCQRFHGKTFPYGTAEAQNSGTFAGSLQEIGAVANQTFVALWRFPVTMRAAPTITTYCPNASTANWNTVTTTPTASVGNLGDSGIAIQGTTSVTAGSGYNIHASADAEL